MHPNAVGGERRSSHSFLGDFSGHQDFEPHANREPTLELVGRILSIFAVYLNGIEEKILLDSFDSDGLDFGELTVVVFNFTFYSFAGKHFCLLHFCLSI
jgi:hypothetical protein